MTDSPTSGRAYLTEEGRHLLEERIELLQATVADLHDAAQDPERSTDTIESYHRASLELERLRSLLGGAATLDAVPTDPEVVELGDSVTIRLQDGSEEIYIITHPAEAAMADQRISAASPLGRSLLGRRVGEAVEVAAPTGGYRCEILRALRRPRPGAPGSSDG